MVLLPSYLQTECAITKNSNGSVARFSYEVTSRRRISTFLMTVKGGRA
jgi:hypothetical protein